jgi:hypothetical protein
MPFGPQHNVAGISTSVSPAITSLDGVLYLFWTNIDNRLWWARSSDNGATWVNIQALQLGDLLPASSDGPTVVSANNSLYLFWKGEPGDNRIYSATFNRTTWTDQEPISPSSGGVPETSAAPAAAMQGTTIHLAWRGASSSEIWWLTGTNGAWGSQKHIFGVTGAAPALVVDGNLVVWIAWMGVPAEGLLGDFAGIFFSSFDGGEKWNAQTQRAGNVGTSARPTLVSTGTDSRDIAMAWKGVGGDSNMCCGTLRLPPVVYDFTFVELAIRNMRTGHLGVKNGTDTDYAAFGVQVVGQQPQVVTKALGDQTGGIVPVDLHVTVSVQDTDTLIVHYSVINSSIPASSALSYIQKAATSLLDLAVKADLVAMNKFFGLDLSVLTPPEQGAVFGAQLGAFLDVAGSALGGLGVIIGALAGFFASDVWGFAFPDCDGPVAAAVHAFNSTMLLGMATNLAPTPQGKTYVAQEDNPGVTSAGGCGSNSDYGVQWTIAPVNG